MHQARLARQRQEAQKRREAAQSEQQQAAEVIAPEADPTAASDSTSSSASASAQSTDQRLSSNPRYFSFRFKKFAAQRDLQGALAQLQAEGEQLFNSAQEQRRQQHLAALQQQRAADEALTAAGKTPPPRKQCAPWEDKQPSALDSLSQHPPSVYASLLRTFAHSGDVDNCYALLTTLYQLSMHSRGLEPWQDATPQQQEASHPHASMRERMEQAGRQQHEAEQQKQRNERRSPFTPNAATLATVMLAYTYSTQRYDVAHHHQLFTHHASLHLPPSPKFHHALLHYHAAAHSVHTYLAALSLLSRRHAVGSDVYVRAVRHFGLKRRDHDGALVLFLALSSLFAPQAMAFNTMIGVFGEKGEWMLAALLMDDMRRQKQRLTAWTYAGVIRALLVGGKEKEGRALYEYVRSAKRDEISTRGQFEDNMHTVMMDWARQHGDTDGVMRVWAELKADGAVVTRDTYALVMQTLLATGDVSGARAVMDEMLRSKAKLGPATHPIALQVLAAAKDYRVCRVLLSEYVAFMRGSELQVARSVYSTALSAVPPPETTPSPEEVASVCRYCLSLLHDVCVEGSNATPGSFVAEVAEVMKRYGAHEAARELHAGRLQESLSRAQVSARLAQVESSVQRHVSYVVDKQQLVTAREAYHRDGALYDSI